MSRAIFLDKEGTLVRDVPYNVNPDFISLMPNDATGVKLLKDNYFLKMNTTAS